MPRIDPLSAPYQEDVARYLERLMPNGVAPLRLFTTIAHNPRVLRSMARGGLLDPGSITVAQRELAILRTCALCDAEYEWGVHVALFAAQADLSQLQVEATRSGGARDPIWNHEQRLIIALCDALHACSTVDDVLFAELASVFRNEQILELVALVGLYHFVSFLANTAAIQPEAWAQRFTRDGDEPAL